MRRARPGDLASDLRARGAVQRALERRASRVLEAALAGDVARAAVLARLQARQARTGQLRPYRADFWPRSDAE